MEEVAAKKAVGGYSPQERIEREKQARVDAARAEYLRTRGY
jgi:hypothetical protein